MIWLWQDRTIALQMWAVIILRWLSTLFYWRLLQMQLEAGMILKKAMCRRMVLRLQQMMYMMQMNPASSVIRQVRTPQIISLLQERIMSIRSHRNLHLPLSWMKKLILWMALPILKNRILQMGMRSFIRPWTMTQSHLWAAVLRMTHMFFFAVMPKER